MAFGNATKGYVKKHSGGGGGGGTTNYSELTNKPSINGVTLDGNKTSEDLGIAGGGGGLTFNNCTVTQDGALVYIDVPKTANILFLLTNKPNYGMSYLSMTVPIPFISKLITIGRKLDMVYQDEDDSNRLNATPVAVRENGNNYRITFNNSFINVEDARYC